jgi:hypothetical protein
MFFKEIFMKKTIVLLISFLFVTTALSTPSYMYVGTYAINNYTGNGGGASDLNYAISTANAFWNAADNYSPLALRYLNLTDANVTYETVSNNGTREYLDFLYFYGHGNSTGLFLGNATGYGMVGYPQLAFGTNYMRWVYSDACEFLISNPVRIG